MSPRDARTIPPSPLRASTLSANGAVDLDAQRQTQQLFDDPAQLEGDVFTFVAQELSVPLANIKGFADLLLEQRLDALTAEQAEFLGIIAENADREVRALGQILEYARIRAGRVELNFTAVDFDALLERSVAQARESNNSRGIRIAVRRLERPVTVVADGDRLLRILRSMLDAMCRRAADGAHITIVTQRSGPFLTVLGADTPTVQEGSPTVRPVQTPSAVAADEGQPDLDIAIARGLARLHGGDLRITRSAGSGTAAQLWLPLEQEWRVISN